MGTKRDRWSSDDEGEDPEGTSSHGHNVVGDSTAKSALRDTDGSSRIESARSSSELARFDLVESCPLTRRALSDVTLPNAPPPGFFYHNPLLHGCRSVYDSYERLSHLDEGTYGVVWKARDNSTGEIVAIKQIKFDSDMTKEGFPISALREIGVLLSLRHDSVVTVREMVVGSSFEKVFMVMECMEMDLQAAMKNCPSANAPFAQSEVKFMMHHILSAMAHVHEHWFIHRDVKTSNILVHKSGRLALCDFGLARKYELPPRKMTQMVVTLWYRSPELLFGEIMYGPEIDMWR